MSSSARHNLSFVQESTYGVTPATPAFIDFPHSACSLALTKEGSASTIIREDRQVHNFRHGLKQVGGDISSMLMPLALDDILEAVLMGDWTGTGPFVLSPGLTRRSFSVLRNFQDLEAADEPFHLFKGVEFNTLALAVTTKGVSFKVGCLGKDLVPGASAPAGSTFGEPSVEEEFTGLSGTIKEGGATVGVISEVSLNLENGQEPKFVVMQDTTNKPKVGKSNLSGSITAYFESATLLNKFINGTASSIQFALTINGYTYDFLIPALKYTGGQPDTSDQTDVVLTMPFQAYYDETEDTNLVITKTVP